MLACLVFIALSSRPCLGLTPTPIGYLLHSKAVRTSPLSMQSPNPPIDGDRRSRSPGLQNNFYDVPTSDFKRPFGSGPAPPDEAMASSASYEDVSNGDGGYPAPAAFGAESSMPGREQQYRPQASGLGGMGGTGDGYAEGGYSGASIDEERRRRSPGLQKNFYDTPTSDFKRPYGSAGRSAPLREPAPPAARVGVSNVEQARGRSGTPDGFFPAVYGAAERQAARGPRAARGPSAIPKASFVERASAAIADNVWGLITGGFGSDGRRNNRRPSGNERQRVMQQPGYGVESPMPGREQDYRPTASGSAGMGGTGDGYGEGGYSGASIDEERRRRSPGLQKNFYDTPTSDFKRPYGGRSASPASPARSNQVGSAYRTGIAPLGGGASGGADFWYGFGAAAGLVANAVVAVSLYDVASTGDGLPHGPWNLVEGLEVISFVVVAVIIGAAALSKERTV